MSEKKLMRSTNKVVAGVLGGLAEFLGIDTTFVRICFVVLSFLSAGSGFLLYIIMMLLMPEHIDE